MCSMQYLNIEYTTFEIQNTQSILLTNKHLFQAPNSQVARHASIILIHNQISHSYFCLLAYVFSFKLERVDNKGPSQYYQYRDPRIN